MRHETVFRPTPMRPGSTLASLFVRQLPVSGALDFMCRRDLHEIESHPKKGVQGGCAGGVRRVSLNRLPKSTDLYRYVLGPQGEVYSLQ